jgi:hypothetical protein
MENFEFNDTLSWLEIALNNQRYLIKNGESQKFPCSNEQEKEISLKAINGFFQIMKEYYNLHNF